MYSRPLISLRCGTDLQKMATADKCYLFLINVLFYQNVLLLFLDSNVPELQLVLKEQFDPHVLMLKLGEVS